jgi:cyclopropane fatty-acyl-phospholipid synthase-like methyltransferase
MAIQKSPSVERNKKPILEILKLYIQRPGRLLEIGSGTAEHAVFMAKNIPEVQWVTSDCKENHQGIKELLKQEKLANVHGPEKLKIGEDDFPKGKFDYVFSANTLHIMSWNEGQSFIKLCGKRLREGSQVLFYGPFNYNGEFSSQSNEQFNMWLKERNEKSGIRNFEDVKSNMEKVGFKFVYDHEMPANNRILVFERMAFKGK